MVVNRNPIKSIERNLNNFLKNWLQKKDISLNNNFTNYVPVTLLPKAYGLPKIRKENTPLRIIVSSINTALYSFASFLHKITSDSLEHTNSHIIIALIYTTLFLAGL